MKKSAIYFTLVYSLMHLSIAANSQDYQLVWSDEFNGIGAPDPSKWGYEIGYIRNNELQYYTNSTNNVKQNDGSLEVTVIKENVGGKQYTSGSVVTLNKSSWKYGKIEGRFKMPKGKGLWACFWTLGSNFPQIGWPKCGEIDIFEHVNNETVIHATTHWAGASDLHVKSSSSYTVDVTQWHIYSITWDANYIRWYVDGNEFFKFRITDGFNYTEEFHLPHYILINLPIGGNWPGPPDATTILPATMYCDYVRVYEDTSTETIAISSFSISPNTMTISTGGKQSIKTIFVPENVTNQTVKWTSDNTSVATVNNWGLVTANSVGTANIQGTTADGRTALCTVNVQDLANINRITNGNFDSDKTATQAPKGWSEWGPGISNAQTSEADPHSAKYKGIQWGTTAFEVAVYQTLTGLPNGTYTLKAWVRSSGGQNTSIMYAKGFGGSEKNYSLVSSIPSWTLIQIDNIKVINNQCEVGFYQTTGKPNKWIDYDDVEFYLTAPSSARVGGDSMMPEEDKHSISIYPNPASNTLEVAVGEMKEFDLTITGADGNVVYSQLTNTTQTLKVDLPDLTSGVYFVTISNGSYVKVEKIFIR